MRVGVGTEVAYGLKIRYRQYGPGRLALYIFNQQLPAQGSFALAFNVIQVVGFTAYRYFTSVHSRPRKFSDLYAVGWPRSNL